jgi:LPXTG-motif cell wall-anchored protein
MASRRSRCHTNGGLVVEEGTVVAQKRVVRTVATLLLSGIALVVMLAVPASAQDYPPSQSAPPAPSVGAQPAAGSQSAGGSTTRTLPRTGSDPAPWIWIGLAALTVGAVLVISARRRVQVRTRRDSA